MHYLLLQNELREKFNFCLNKPYILVTAHRRENIGEGIKNITLALKTLATQHPHLNIVFPVHKNPNIRSVVYENLQDFKNVFLIEP